MLMSEKLLPSKSSAQPPMSKATLVKAMVAVFLLLHVLASAIVVSGLADRLVDPPSPYITAVVVFALTAGAAYSWTRRREVFLRRRLEQHLAPAVARSIVEQPDLVKLDGERREVTALFTDIEGFTTTTHRVGLEELVAMLDQYFEGVSGIVIKHGGMIDKIVGDGVHALFNAPFDLEDHPQHAVECAIAIQAWSDGFRSRAPAAPIELGRTRIGIETGPAVVGDVGIRSKLDYTAHGDAVNMAARLEASNKELGSAVCVGPGAAARCNAALLRPLGQLAVQGRAEPISVFEPWPNDAPSAWREAYLAAYAMLDRDTAYAGILLQKLIAERPLDLAVRRLAERLSSIRKSNLPPAWQPAQCVGMF